MSQMPIIINATVTDIPAIRHIAAAVWPQTYVPIIGEQQVDYMLNTFYAATELQRQMEAAGHKFIICKSDRGAVGFASWSLIEPGIYKLHKLYILPGQQGKGIGHAMLDHIISDIKQEGAAALRLNVNRYNHPAIAFYEKTGFVHYKDEDIDIGNGFFMNDHVLQLPV
jgi:ribosomal protein S18 acetylase RimI-like enzyme